MRYPFDVSSGRANALESVSQRNRGSSHMLIRLRLEGPAFEIHVGKPNLSGIFGAGRTEKTWFLSRALLCHFSPFFKERQGATNSTAFAIRVELTDEYPIVFGLFVEWMLSKQYDTPISPASVAHTVDINAWVLGARLGVEDFQDYAMRRLYSQYTGVFVAQPVTSDLVREVFTKTIGGSQLRKFFVHVLAEDFTNLDRVKGTTEEWDTVLQEFPNLRLYLLNSLRTSQTRRSFVGWSDQYLVKGKTAVSRGSTQVQEQPMPVEEPATQGATSPHVTRIVQSMKEERADRCAGL